MVDDKKSGKIDKIITRLYALRPYPNKSDDQMIQLIKSLTSEELNGTYKYKLDFTADYSPLEDDSVGSSPKEFSLLEYAAANNNPSAVKALLEHKDAKFSKEQIEEALVYATDHRDKRIATRALDVGNKLLDTCMTATALMNGNLPWVDSYDGKPPEPAYDMVKLLKDKMKALELEEEEVRKRKSTNDNLPSPSYSYGAKDSESLLKKIKEAKTIDEARESLKNSQAFTIASEDKDSQGNAIIVYNDPRHTDNKKTPPYCPPEFQVTYIIGLDQKLKKVIAGEKSECIIPIFDDKNGFECNHIANGKVEKINSFKRDKEQSIEFKINKKTMRDGLMKGNKDNVVLPHKQDPKKAAVASH